MSGCLTRGELVMTFELWNIALPWNVDGARCGRNAGPDASKCAIQQSDGVLASGHPELD